MGMVANIKSEIRFLGGLVRLLKRIKPIALDSDVLICDDIEEAVDKYPDNICVEDETRRLTYREFEALANRYANWAASRNLKRGDTIALLMHNRVEYVAAWFGFSKVGVATALINNNLNGSALAHCLNISGAFNVVTDEDCWQAAEDSRGLIDRDIMLWVLGLGEENETNTRRDFDNAVRSASSVRPDRGLRKGLTNRDTALYIYTSGTTGLPKAARIPHSRARTYMRAF
ncbi:long-chain acyl-CoA synthetase, partial [Brevundimonas sp. GN22]